MTFDEAIEIVEVFDEDPELEYWMPSSKVYEIIERLREEYAPTIEMTNYQKGLLLRYLEDLSFSELISDVYLSRADGAGDEHGDRYDGLSDEDIMNAWLHPETIKIVDE